MLLSNSVVEPQYLPPTRRAAYFHALLVNLQICQRATLDLQCRDPLKWGLGCKSQLLRPVQTEVDVAPVSFLKFIRCQCKVTAKDPCASNRCSCRKSGISCVIASSNCRDMECCNSNTAADNTSSSIEDVDDGKIFALFS